MPPSDVRGAAPAKRRKPRPSPVFSGLGRADTALTTAQRTARRRVERAQRNLPERPLPSIPVLAHPTQRQAEHAVRLANRAVKRIAVSQRGEVRQDPRSRAKLAGAVHAQRTLEHNLQVRLGMSAVRANPGAYGLEAKDVHGLHRAAAANKIPEATRNQLAAIGRGAQSKRVSQAKPAAPRPAIHVSNAAASEFASNPVGFLTKEAAKQLAATGIALATHPKKTVPRTLSGLAQQVVGIPAAIGELQREASLASGRGDVPGVVRALGRPLAEAGIDYQRRYSGSIGQRAKRIQKEGAAAELTDLATALTSGGAAAGRGFVSAARAGALPGRVGEEFFGAERPRLRYSGGRAGVREQDLSGQISRVVVQRIQDRLRAAASQRPDAEGRVRGLQPQQTATEKSISRQNRKREARGQEPLGVRTQGEVTPLFNKSAKREQRIAASRASARSYIGTRHEQAAELNQGTERELANLSPRQRRAVFHVTQGLVPLEADVATIRAALGERRKQVTREQAKAGVSEPKVLRKHTELRALEFLDRHAEEIFGDPRLREFHEANLKRQERLAAEDPGLRSQTAETRRYRPQGEHLGIKYDPGDRAGDALESYQRDYVGRVQRAAQERGLPEPGYFKHAKRLLPRLSLRTGGNVSRGMAGVKRSDLKLLREGRAVTDPDVLVQGLAENIKRKHNWNAVADVVDEHAFSWSRGKRGGSSIGHLQDVIDKRGLRHQDVAFLNLGIVRKAAKAASDSDGALNEALSRGIVSGAEARKLADAGDELVKERGFVALPKAVADELLESTRPPSRGQRLVGKAQGLQSAAILGLNPSFLEVQVAANALQSGAAMRGQFADLARSQAWYRHLDPQQRKVVDESLGVGVFEGHTSVARLGSTAGPVARALAHIGDAPIVRTGKGTVRITDLNPTKGMFRADDAQNRLFRRAVLYNDLKRQAFGKLTKDVGRAQASLRVLGDWANLRPGESVNHAVSRLLENPAAVERAARHVDEALGDYLRYTARERRAFKPYILFYGFFRYALKTLFYTLPVRHPLLGSIGLKLGQLHNEELRRVFGARDLPTYSLSRALTFSRSGRPVKTPEGTFKTVDFGRINPLTSPATELVTEGPQRLAGVVSPLAQAGLNLVARKNISMDRPLTLHGSAAEVERIGAGDAARVVANQTLSAAFPFRLVTQLRSGGRTQSDDALPWSLRPITYKSADAQAREAERVRSRASAKDLLAQQLAPLVVPRIDRTAQSISRKAGQGTDSLAGVSPAERRALLREAAHVARQQATPAAKAQAAAELREAQYLLRQGAR